MNDHDSVPADNEEASADAVSCEPGPAPAQGGEKLVPVSEARRYRKRAQAAETILADLQDELKAKDQAARQQEKTIADLQRARQIDDLLIAAGALDLETARLLTELTISGMDDPDTAEAVADLQRRKPFLFRCDAGGSGALSPRRTSTFPADHLDQAAAEACATGQRQDLLRYLRLRRKR